jgi:hypothetical protein
MMPFTDNGMKYYTGLYTSRPNLKSFIRKSSNIFLSANKILFPRIVDSNTDKKDSQANLKSLNQFSDIISTSLSADVITGVCRSGLEKLVTDKLE